jgi:hypothetical protein
MGLGNHGLIEVDLMRVIIDKVILPSETVEVLKVVVDVAIATTDRLPTEGLLSSSGVKDYYLKHLKYIQQQLNK